MAAEVSTLVYRFAGGIGPEPLLPNGLVIETTEIYTETLIVNGNGNGVNENSDSNHNSSDNSPLESLVTSSDNSPDAPNAI